jgi:hypothetical protein
MEQAGSPEKAANSPGYAGVRVQLHEVARENQAGLVLRKVTKLGLHLTCLKRSLATQWSTQCTKSSISSTHVSVVAVFERTRSLHVSRRSLSDAQLGLALHSSCGTTETAQNIDVNLYVLFVACSRACSVSILI